MASRWNIKDYHVSKFCLVDGCDLGVLKCPDCGFPGHEAYHKASKQDFTETIATTSINNHTIDTLTVINHTHFIEGSDLLFAKARNFWHEIKRTKVAKKHYEKHYILPERERMTEEFIDQVKITKDDYKK